MAAGKIKPVEKNTDTTHLERLLGDDAEKQLVCSQVGGENAAHGLCSACGASVQETTEDNLQIRLKYSDLKRSGDY